MKKSKNNKGITLITLAITIIVILILAGISVATLFGENGLFNSALTAKEKTEIANYQEIINLSTTYAHTNYKEKDPENILKIIKEELQKEEKFKEAKITGPDKNEEEQKLIIVTKEGYVFYVYEKNNKYIGKKEEIGETELNIEIKEGYIKYTYKPSGWTNKDVEVGIEITKEEYKQYQIEYTYTPKENNSWKEYKEGEIVEKTNGRTIYARLTNGLSATKIYVAGTITNIDKQQPIINTELVTSNVTENGFTISVDVTDSDSGLGKIIWYHKKSDEDTYTPSEEIYTELNGNTAGTTSAVTKSKTYDNLTSGDTYNIYAEVFDVAGNKVRIPKEGTIEETVKKIEGQVTLSANSGTYTSGADTFTVTNNISGGTLTVTSSNSNIATATISGNIVTITPGTTEGTATITVTSEATGIYDEATAEYTATVGHHFASKTTTADYLASAADCTHEETYYYKCTRCSEKGTETYTNGSALGHSSTTGGTLKTAATCTSAAVYYHKCSRCGVNLSTTYTSGNALGHSSTTGGTLKTAATCTSAAVYYHKCSRCGVNLSTTYSSGSALGHNYKTSYIRWSGNSFTSSTHDDTNHVTTFIYDHSTENLTDTVSFYLYNNAQNYTNSSYAWQLNGGSSGKWYAGGAWTTSGLNWALKNDSGNTYLSGTSGYQSQYQKTGNTLASFYLNVNGYGVSPFGLNFAFNLPDVRKHKCTRCSSEYYDYNG